jgi:hypothetical protein
MFWAIALDAEEMGERGDRGHSIPNSTIFKIIPSAGNNFPDWIAFAPSPSQLLLSLGMFGQL